jgi:hypothetical protein
MATRMNMLKLLQEVRGFAQFPTLPADPGPTGPLLLQFRGPRSRRAQARRKKVIRIDMQEPTDIPRPVPITYLAQTSV